MARLTESVDIKVDTPNPKPAIEHVACDYTITDYELRKLYMSPDIRYRAQLERWSAIAIVTASLVVTFTAGMIVGGA